MMKYGFVDADLLDGGTRFPNLALMKLAGYYRAQGHDVALCFNADDAANVDRLFVSKVFTKSKTPEWAERRKGAVFGGTGYFGASAPALDPHIEHSAPFYEIYAPFVARFKKRPAWLDYYDRAAIGFLTRGCFRRCPFCVNREKRRSERWSALEEFDRAEARFVVALDDNVFACSEWESVFDELDASGKRFTFRQGLDLRLVDEKKARRLQSARYKGEVYFAFDNVKDAPIIEKKLEVYRRDCAKDTTAYVLCGYYEEGVDAIASALKRIEILSRYQVRPYIMRYESVYRGEFASIWAGVAAWCNQPHIFKKQTFFDCIAERSRKAWNDARKLPTDIINKLDAVYWERGKCR